MRFLNVACFSNVFSILLFFKTTIAASAPTMMVMYGYPTTGLKYTTSVVNWDSCIEYCQTDNNCVLAYSDSETIKCDIYYFDLISTVQLTDQSSGTEKKVALKMNSGQCLAEKSSNFPAKGNTQTGTYSVTLNSPANTLNITYEYDTACFEGTDTWFNFGRNGKTWCMKIIPVDKDIGGCSRKDTIQNCANNRNSVLTGIASQFESMFFANWLTASSNGNAEVAIDGERKCTDSDGQLTCEIFEFSSNYMEGPFNNSLFASGYPAKMDEISSFSNCLELIVPASGDGSPTIANTACSTWFTAYMCGFELK